MTHKTTGRSLRLNHANSRGGVISALPHTWWEVLVPGHNPRSIRPSARRLIWAFPGNSCFLHELEEDCYVE